MIKKQSILASLVLMGAMTLSVSADYSECSNTCAASRNCCHKGCLGGGCGCLAGHQKPYLGVSQQRAAQYNWHGNYNHNVYGQPMALVVPPTAELQTNWSWGAPSSRVSRIDHQFGRNYPGPGAVGGGFRNTPVWPADTGQFGVYYVRAPWYPTQR